MANAVKMLPFPVTSDSAELTLLWGRDIHGPQFGYRIPLMTGQKIPKSRYRKVASSRLSWLVTSVHFKNTVARSSVHSKIWSFPIILQLTLFWFSRCIIENDHNVEWSEDRTTGFLKWTDFSTFRDFQTVYEGEIWCLCTVTFGSKLNSRPVYCLQLYDTHRELL
jgi:hypothetical protein